MLAAMFPYIRTWISESWNYDHEKAAKYENNEWSNKKEEN
jgi:hypothetical protein